MNRALRTVSVHTGALLAVGLLAAPASAVGWYSASSPLKVKEKGVTQGGAYGAFYNAGNTYARNKTVRKDFRPGGNGIYVDTRFSFLENSCTNTGGCTTEWKFSKHKETKRTTSGSWVRQTVDRTLSDEGSKARGAIHVCEDQSWSPDPCSPWTYPTFSY
ncbi:MAG: hypothetical protein PGN07_03550 [Aeromicrobium erythreum]